MKPLALVTGATGFIGPRTVLELLQSGYRVRLTIRRDEQANKLRRIFNKYDQRIEFLTVPDITAEGAFDIAVRDVQYILHVASPLPGSQDLLTPAVRGTVSILESASRIPSVKKVVITASAASFMPLTSQQNGSVITETEDIPYNIDYKIISLLDPMTQYRASKVASYKAVLEFVRDQKPTFDVVTLHPIFVYGRNLVQEKSDSPSGTCGMLFRSLISEKPLVGQFLGVHVDDVATAHVRALNTSITGFRSFLLSATRRSWVEVETFVRRQYPQLPIKLKAEDWEDYTVDASKAEKELGLCFKSMEDQVKDVVDQQLELGKFDM
ncbi:hypothetical protein FE257_010417 [Aspergillus nanangensis]|uniref:NAD-dependent epimerase/dehydratase domain-containing protein n=1 Tax=Aspergillus nanangensis TaxID=2582783 RepID=A0AAD4CJZ2_ASPNN|nr:hypothetical protein FE257_010417 [Aspergillus nanangensis]